MNRTTKDAPPFEHQIHCQVGVCEDLWFGTYWALDAHNRPSKGPFNTIAEARDAYETRVDVV